MKALGFGQKPLVSPLPATRDDARMRADQFAELARRRGGAADILRSPLGMEAPAGGKATLGS